MGNSGRRDLCWHDQEDGYIKTFFGFFVPNTISKFQTTWWTWTLWLWLNSKAQVSIEKIKNGKVGNPGGDTPCLGISSMMQYCTQQYAFIPFPHTLACRFNSLSMTCKNVLLIVVPNSIWLYYYNYSFILCIHQKGKHVCIADIQRKGYG